MDDNLLASKRELWIDVLRGIGILLVVLGHAEPPFGKFIYGFHMPLFFLISGLLWRNMNSSITYVANKNMKRYIIPYFVLCGINLMLRFVLLLVLPVQVSVGKYIIGILYSRGTTEWMPNCSPLWFLTAIFVALLFFELIQRIRTKLARVILIFVLGLSSALLSYLEIFKLPWNIDTAMMGTVFIGIGYLLKKERVLCWVEKRPAWLQIIGLICIVAFGVLSIHLNPIDAVGFDGNRYGNVLLMLIGALSICFVLFYLCYRINWSGAVAKILSWFGQHTIFIMGFDYFSGSIAGRILDKAGFQNWLSMFLLKVIILSIGCLIWSAIVRRLKSESLRKVLSF